MEKKVTGVNGECDITQTGHFSKTSRKHRHRHMVTAKKLTSTLYPKHFFFFIEQEVCGSWMPGLMCKAEDRSIFFHRKYKLPDWITFLGHNSKSKVFSTNQQWNMIMAASCWEIFVKVDWGKVWEPHFGGFLGTIHWVETLRKNQNSLTRLYNPFGPGMAWGGRDGWMVKSWMPFMWLKTFRFHYIESENICTSTTGQQKEIQAM